MIQPEKVIFNPRIRRILLLRSQLYTSGVHHFWLDFYVTRFFISIEPCMIQVVIYPSRTWMSASFESTRWDAFLHRLDLGLSSERMLGNGIRTHVNSKGKSPLPEAQRRVEPTNCTTLDSKAEDTTPKSPNPLALKVDTLPLDHRGGHVLRESKHTCTKHYQNQSTTAIFYLPF